MLLTKWHGCQNDYLFLDGPADPAPEDVRALCDRRAGFGADGLIVLTPGENGVLMRVFNADGTDGGMCGNGARCAAEHAAERGWADGDQVRLTVGDRAVLAERLGAGRVRLGMGEPRLALGEIPVLESELERFDPRGIEHRAGGLPAVFVSMGNPHMVVFVEEDPAGMDLAVIGPRLEHCSAFPERMNLHLVRAVSRGVVEARTWERGAGLTPACGSGACAVVVAGVLTGRTAREIRVRMPGGTLEAAWDDRAGGVFLTGPTARVGAVDWPL